MRSDKGTPRGAAIGLLLCGLATLVAPTGAWARASEVSAKTFLQTIYRTYLGGTDESKGIALADPATVRRYFSPGLAILMLEDGADASRRGTRPMLAQDPFVGAKDADIADLVIDVKDVGVKAVGTVSFTSDGKPHKVVLELLKIGDDWRISDIQWTSGSLRELYRKK